MDAFNALKVKFDQLSEQLDRMSMNQAASTSIICEVCGGGHESSECFVVNQYPMTEQVCPFNEYFFNSHPLGNPSFNTYEPGWHNHPNFFWSNQQQQPTQNPFQNFQPLSFQNFNPPPPQNQQFPQPQKSYMEELLENFILDQQKDIEIMEQQFQKLQQQNQQLQQQNQLSQQQFQQISSKLEQLDTHNTMLETQIAQEVSRPPQKSYDQLPNQLEPNLRGEVQVITLRSDKQVETQKTEEKPIEEEEEERGEPSTIETTEEAPASKHKLEEYKIMTLTRECSAILQNQLPPKLKDPGKFSIPCRIGNKQIDKALCDLGSCVNIIPLSLCRKEQIGNLKPTTMSLQLADQSIKNPVGIIEDVPIMVRKVYIPADFVVLDMKENMQTPIILGRPFLATAGAVIDVKNGRLTLHVGDEKMEFNVFATSKFSSQANSCLPTEDVAKATGKKHATIQAENSRKACPKQGATNHCESFVIQQLMPKTQWREQIVEKVSRTKEKRKKTRITRYLNLYPGRRKRANYNWGMDTDQRNLHPP